MFNRAYDKDKKGGGMVLMEDFKTASRGCRSMPQRLYDPVENDRGDLIKP